MEKCVGCGYCCIKCPCMYAQMLHYFVNRQERCPYIEWNGDRYECLLMKNYKPQEEHTTREFLIVKLVNQMIVGRCENPRNHWRKNVIEGIMEHTLKNGIFCGGGKEMDELCEAGLMVYAGRKSFVPDPYYKITGLGKKYLDNK